MGFNKFSTKIDEKFFKEAVPYVSTEVKMIYFADNAAIEIDKGGVVIGFWTPLEDFYKTHKPAEE